MNIPFRGLLTERDLIRVFTLAAKDKIWYIFVFGPLVLVFSALTYLNRENVGFYLFVLVSMMCGFLASYPFWGPRASANATYRRQADMRGTFEGIISEDEILLHTVNYTQNIKWAVWKRVERNRELVLLYQSAGCFNFFPRSFFASEEDWQKFQTLLDEKIKSGVLKK